MIPSKGPAIIVFLKNPVPGFVKTRLAKTIGHKKALEIYLKLVEITKSAVSRINIPIFWYINEPPGPELTAILPNEIEEMRYQKGNDLGEKMSSAFKEVFKENYSSICIIGTDCPDINQETFHTAFMVLKDHDFVIGPAYDGGYYLLGMNQHEPSLFTGIEWSTDKVFELSSKKIKEISKSLKLLATLTDIDYEEDAVQAGLL